MFGAYSVPTHSPIKSVSRDCAIRESQRSGRREGGSPAEAAFSTDLGTHPTAEEAKALLSDSEVRVRAIGIRRLIALGDRLTAGNIRELLADDSKAQPATLSALLGRAQASPRSDDLVEELFSTLAYEELIQLVSWFSQDGRIAYKVLGLRHFDRFGDRVRTDMAGRFATFRELEKHAMRASITTSITTVLDKKGASEATIAAVEDAAEKAIKQWADLDNFITSRFVSAALAALAKNGSANDLPIARQHLDSKDIVATAHIVKHLCTLGKVSTRQLLFDPRLALDQPIHCRIEIIFVRIDHAELLRQRCRVPQSCRAQLRAGMNELLGNHGDNQIAFATSFRRDESIEFQLVDGAEHCLDMAVGQCPLHDEHIRRSHQGLVSQ